MESESRFFADALVQGEWDIDAEWPGASEWALDFGHWHTELAWDIGPDLLLLAPARYLKEVASWIEAGNYDLVDYLDKYGELRADLVAYLADVLASPETSDYPHSTCIKAIASSGTEGVQALVDAFCETRYCLSDVLDGLLMCGPEVLEPLRKIASGATPASSRARMALSAITGIAKPADTVEAVQLESKALEHLYLEGKNLAQAFLEGSGPGFQVAAAALDVMGAEGPEALLSELKSKDDDRRALAVLRLAAMGPGLRPVVAQLLELSEGAIPPHEEEIRPLLVASGAVDELCDALQNRSRTSQFYASEVSDIIACICRDKPQALTKFLDSAMPIELVKAAASTFTILGEAPDEAIHKLENLVTDGIRSEPVLTALAALAPASEGLGSALGDLIQSEKPECWEALHLLRRWGPLVDPTGVLIDRAFQRWPTESLKIVWKFRWFDAVGVERIIEVIGADSGPYTSAWAAWVLGEFAASEAEDLSTGRVLEVLVEAFCRGEPLLQEASFEGILNLAPKLGREQLDRISEALAVAAWRYVSESIDDPEGWWGFRLRIAKENESALRPPSQAEVEALAVACVSPSPSLREAASKDLQDCCVGGVCSEMASSLAALPLENFDLES